jgi:hypothetical protein
MNTGSTLPMLPTTLPYQQFFHAQLGRAVEVDRARGLVGRQPDHRLDLALERRVDEVGGSVDVGADRFDRVVLGQRHVLHRGRVHDDVDAPQRSQESRAIADVPEEEAQARVIHLALHHVVLLLVAREHDDLRGRMLR